jgi:hypothetical protein
MISKNKIRFIAVGTIAAATVAVAAGAASALVQSNGSASGLYLYDSNGTLTTNSTTFNWNSDAVTSSSSSDANAVFTCNANSTGSFAFIVATSKTDAATTPSGWDASKNLGSRVSAKDLLTVNLAPSSFNLGAPAAVKAAGGNYYLGMACTSNNGLTVEQAFYRTVAVTAGTGAYHTTDTVATNDPAVAVTPASTKAATGTTATFTAAVSGEINPSTTFTDATIQWQRAESGSDVFSNISGATSATYTTAALVAGDNGAKFRAVATKNSTVKTSNAATLEVSSTFATVALSADVLAAVDGTLALSVPSNAAATFQAPTLVNNKSTTLGTLPAITVTDERVATRKGWTLQADVADFTTTATSSTTADTKISKAQLGIKPSYTSGTAAGYSVAAEQVAGSAVYPAAFASADKDNKVGTTVLGGDLTFVAPQEKPAGTYTSTLSLTLASK